MLFEIAAYILAVTNVVSFFLSAWGALFIIWGAAKAARRMFWTEAQPWMGPQLTRLEQVRGIFGHRILLGLEFFLAADLIRLLVDPSVSDLIRIGAIVIIRIALSFFITREVRLPAPVLDLRAVRRKTA